MRAFAAKVFKSNAAAPEVPLGQAGEAVRLVDFKHIALQHGVVCVALNFNAVVGKHMPVVLDVLAEFEFGGVLQPRLEPGQHLVTRQLRGCVGVVVGQGNVGGLPRIDAETDADNLSSHLVDGGGFGIKRCELSHL